MNNKLNIALLAQKSLATAIISIGALTACAENASENPSNAALKSASYQGDGTPMVKPRTELLQGEWYAIARVCLPSGRPAQDQFDFKTDRLSVEIVGNQAIGKVSFSNDSWQVSGVVDAERQVMDFPKTRTKNTTFEASNLAVELTAFPTLILTSNGFGQGGSCMPGESLKTYLRKSGGQK